MRKNMSLCILIDSFLKTQLLTFWIMVYGSRQFVGVIRAVSFSQVTQLDNLSILPSLLSHPPIPYLREGAACVEIVFVCAGMHPIKVQKLKPPASVQQNRRRSEPLPRCHSPSLCHSPMTISCSSKNCICVGSCKTSIKIVLSLVSRWDSA